MRGSTHIRIGEAMAVIETKYSIGDRVFFATTRMERRQHPCPDCLGTKKWQAQSPAGQAYEFACPRCTATYQGERELSLGYTMHTPYTRALTIGSVRFNDHGDSGPSYMCVETGIGSGNVYRENDLFPDQSIAEAAAAAKAAMLNTEPDGWVKKRYDRTLALCDYNMDNAMLKMARDRAIRHGVDLQMLFENLRDAATMEQIRETVDNFKFRDEP